MRHDGSVITISHGRQYENGPYESGCPVDPGCPWSPVLPTADYATVADAQNMLAQVINAHFAEHQLGNLRFEWGKLDPEALSLPWDGGQ